MDSQNKTGEEQNILSELLSNPKVMAALSDIAANLKTQMTEPTEDAKAEAVPAAAPKNEPPSDLLNPEVLQKLPEVMAALSPVLSGGSEKKSHDKKTALLNALRPYLSAGRCEAIDYIARLEKLGDVVKNIRL